MGVFLENLGVWIIVGRPYRSIYCLEVLGKLKIKDDEGWQTSFGNQGCEA